MFVGSFFYSPDNNENRVIVLISIVYIAYTYGLPRRNRGTFCIIRPVTTFKQMFYSLNDIWDKFPVILFIEDTAKEKRS